MPLRLIISIILLLQIAACGFHLRGSNQIEAKYNPLFIVSDELNANQLALIRKELTSSSAIVTEQPAGSNRLLLVFSNAKQRKIANSSLSDFELLQIQMSLQYSLQTSAGRPLIDPDELLEKADIQLDKSNVLVNEQTVTSAQKELQRKLVRRLILRLSR